MSWTPEVSSGPALDDMPWTPSSDASVEIARCRYDVREVWVVGVDNAKEGAPAMLCAFGMTNNDRRDSRKRAVIVEMGSG